MNQQGAGDPITSILVGVPALQLMDLSLTKPTLALPIIEPSLLASLSAGRARRTAFSMFTNISTSLWCHHLIRSLARLAPLWQQTQSPLTKPVSLRQNLALRMRAEQRQ